jgi:hypothetical protein
VRTVDVAFVGCLLLVLLMAAVLATAMGVAKLEPTPVPYVTPTPQILHDPR